MKKFQKILIGLLASMLFWLVGMSFISLFGDGFFYYTEQPLKIVEVTVDTARVRFRRYSRLNMAGEIVHELQCQQLYHFPVEYSLLERGWSEFDLVFLLPKSAKGECLYRWYISYHPFGRFGPTLTHSVKSEKFQIIE